MLLIHFFTGRILLQILDSFYTIFKSALTIVLLGICIELNNNLAIRNSPSLDRDIPREREYRLLNIEFNLETLYII